LTAAAISGTFPLPDSQLDRFLLRLSMGYPQAEYERAMLAGADRRELIQRCAPQLSAQDVLALREAVSAVHASEALVDYVQRLLAASRSFVGLRVGLSPRAGLALLRAARAHALLAGRAHVLPEDVQSLFVEATAHRLVAESGRGSPDEIARRLLASVAVDA
jgi:MoxR-like ATPase